MDPYHHQPQVVCFDHQYLTMNPRIVQALAEVYCRTWERDENFHEYRICPICHQYYSYKQVEEESVVACSSNHCSAELVKAWVPEQVAEMILHDSQSEFHGVILQLPESGRIIGFAWGCKISPEHIQNTWGQAIAKKIQAGNPNPGAVYFDELAVDPEFRGQGFGKLMARNVCEWMVRTYPEMVSMLRTHQKSPALHIYRQLGYEVIGQDSQYGDGRVMLVINPTSAIKL